MALVAKGEPSVRTAGIVHERRTLRFTVAGAEGVGDVDGDELGVFGALLGEPLVVPEPEPEFEPPLPPPPPQAVVIKAIQLMMSHLCRRLCIVIRGCLVMKFGTSNCKVSRQQEDCRGS